jgi:thioredoxin 1
LRAGSPLHWVDAWRGSSLLNRAINHSLRAASCTAAPTWRNIEVSDRIVHVTDDTFEQDVLQSDQPVLVDYWANWCAPCKMIAPILEEIAEEYDGRIKVAKLDIDENRAVTERFNVRGIPTLILFKNGEAEAIKVGAVSKSQLTVFIDSNL